MKLLIAIVQNKFIDKLVDEFTNNNIQITKIASSGGFFKSGNTTLLIGSNDEQLDLIDKIFKSVTESERIEGESGEKYNVSGATVFELNVEKNLRI